jgi:hypothetical protein
MPFIVPRVTSILERSYRLRVSAECFQFLIADVSAEGDLSWDERTLIELFTLAPGTIGIGTNCEGLVSVEVQVWSSDAEFDAQPWFHANGGNISCDHFV